MQIDLAAHKANNKLSLFKRINKYCSIECHVELGRREKMAVGDRSGCAVQTELSSPPESSLLRHQAAGQYGEHDNRHRLVELKQISKSLQRLFEAPMMSPDIFV